MNHSPTTINSDGTLSTSDLNLAAYLIINGARLAGITKSGRMGTFLLSDVPPLAAESYDLGMALVEPISFHNKIKQLTTSVNRLA